MNNIVLGRSDFKKVRKTKAYYVDKSLFVKDVIKNPHETILIPRPRRFGKAMNLSLLHHFFEKREEDESWTSYLTLN